MLGTDLLAALPELRAHAESRMTATVLVESVAITTNQTTGAPIVTATTVYSGKARVKAGATNANTSGAASSVQSVHLDELHVPVGSGPFQVGHRVTVVSDATNPALVGNQYRVTRLHEGSQTTAQRLEVESWAALMT